MTSLDAKKALDKLLLDEDARIAVINKMTQETPEWVAQLAALHEGGIEERLAKMVESENRQASKPSTLKETQDKLRLAEWQRDELVRQEDHRLYENRRNLQFVWSVVGIILLSIVLNALSNM